MDTTVVYDNNNIFSQIINGKIPVKKIYEDELLIVIEDIKPVAPIHLLVIPKGKYKNYSDFIANADSDEVKHYFAIIAKVVKNIGLVDKGYRLVANQGQDAGQTIFHFHTHIIGGEILKDM